ncbi:MAG: hypothetical protein K9G49_10110 [Taibaiella sp.]|nr:hypothetical protein [Taibaiella sp.]
MEQLNTPDFAGYAEQKIKELSILKNFLLPALSIVTIDLDGELPADIVTHLLVNRHKPAVYYFTIEEDKKQDIFLAFQKAKSNSSHTKRTAGLRAEGFKNICHVPQDLKPGNCLYVGSVKTNLLSRLNQHLGYTNSGRTGALYLKHVLATLPEKPPITFHYHILDSIYKDLTEHIESILYDLYLPIVGKRPL